jgi:hypothetical protein
VVAMGLGLWWFASALKEGYRKREYAERYIECDYKEFINNLEDAFGFDFPEDIRNTKTAKTVPMENTTLFIVKFSGYPSTVNEFLKSFPETYLLRLKLMPYSLEDDERITPGRWPPPEWFTEGIQQGKRGRYSCADATLRIYIDSSDDDNFIVYIHGAIYH